MWGEHKSGSLVRDPCAVALIDERGRVREASAELARLLARPGPIDLIGLPLAGLVAEGQEVVTRWCDALFAGEDREPIECRLALPGGFEVPVRLTGSRTAEQGAPVALLYLTARTPAGPGGDEPLHVVLDRLYDAVVAFDREWRYVFINRSAEKYIGLPREALLGKVLWEAFPGAVGTELETEYRRAAASDGPSEFELVGPVTGRCVMIRAYPSEAGLVCYYRDVTAEREAVAALRASEQRYRSIFENTLAGMILATESGEVIAANPAACRKLGRTEAELCAVGREGIVDLSDPRLPEFLAERARTGKARAELTLRRKDGSIFPALVSSALFAGAEGERLTSLSFIDLTERQRGERALAFLSEAGAALGASLDLDATLQALMGLVVPSRADLCAVDLVEGVRVRRAAIAHRAPEAAALMASLRTAELEGQTHPRVLKVLRTGEPESLPELEPVVLDAALRMLRGA